jgi:hypothetical protein
LAAKTAFKKLHLRSICEFPRILRDFLAAARRPAPTSGAHHAVLADLGRLRDVGSRGGIVKCRVVPDFGGNAQLELTPCGELQDPRISSEPPQGSSVSLNNPTDRLY